MNGKLTLVFATLVLPALMFGRICTSTDSGAWTSEVPWSCPTAPAAGDTLVITAGHTLTISSNLIYTGSPMLIRVYGTLAFDGGGAKISMPCGSSVIIYPDGMVTANSGGSSQTIKICSDTYWQASDGNVSGPMGWPLNILPVEVAEFTASNTQSGVILAWMTASESGSDHFELQRSSDLLDWEVIGIVDAAGNSSQLMEYSMTDHEVSRGQWYYRLVQVDDDGVRSGNLVVGIEVLGRPESLLCVPNPVSDGRITAITNATSMEDPAPMVRDPQTGRTVAIPTFTNSGDRANITLPQLANGSYILQLNVNGEQRSCRFLIMR